MSNTRSGATTNIGEKRVSIDDDGYKSDGTSKQLLKLIMMKTHIKD